MSSGYSGTPLVKKLGIKSGATVLFVHAPTHYAELLGSLPDAVSQFTTLEQTAGDCDFVHAFYTERGLLEAELPLLKAALTPAGMLWLSWPKKAAGVPTDLDRDTIREMGLAVGLVDVKVGAVDEIWSGLKFVYRKEDRA